MHEKLGGDTQIIMDIGPISKLVERILETAKPEFVRGNDKTIKKKREKQQNTPNSKSIISEEESNYIILNCLKDNAYVAHDLISTIVQRERIKLQLLNGQIKTIDEQLNESNCTYLSKINLIIIRKAISS